MPITITIAEDGPPKRQIIEMAFSEIGAAGYEFGRTAEEITDAQAKLNALMAEWKILRGIDLGYIQPPYGQGNPDTLSGIPFETLNTVALYLALRICPMMGATMSGEARAAMARSLFMLESAYATIPMQPLANDTIRGAGEDHRRRNLPWPYINETYEDVNPDPNADPNADPNEGTGAVEPV
jgi:hypothetical protein